MLMLLLINRLLLRGGMFKLLLISLTITPGNDAENYVIADIDDADAIADKSVYAAIAI